MTTKRPPHPQDSHHIANGNILEDRANSRCKESYELFLMLTKTLCGRYYFADKETEERIISPDE